jgi:hypothetical protein
MEESAGTGPSSTNPLIGLDQLSCLDAHLDVFGWRPASRGKHDARFRPATLPFCRHNRRIQPHRRAAS